MTRTWPTGFVLLREGRAGHYQGVDGRAFEPFVPESSEGPSPERPVGGKIPIWALHPAGWQREAFRLFEESQTGTDLEGTIFLPSAFAARNIQDLLHHTQPARWRVLRCELFDADGIASGRAMDKLYGYDLAYPGGDLYSAINNGLYENPHTDLVAAFGTRLNAMGLFTETNVLDRYLRRFRALVPTEAQSEFVGYDLRII